MKQYAHTIEQLAAVIAYDPETGALTWKRSRSSARAGAEVGCVSTLGYREFRLDYEHYLAHRVAWALHHGEWPTMIDHVNRDRADNRIANLREATSRLNGHNSSDLDRTFLLGPARGVGQTWRLAKYTASIKCNQKLVYLGSYDTAEQASEAYQRAYAERERLYLTSSGDVTGPEAVALMRAAAGSKIRPYSKAAA